MQSKDHCIRSQEARALDSANSCVTLGMSLPADEGVGANAVESSSSPQSWDLKGHLNVKACILK